MPVEDRRIVFDYQEVYKAVYALCIQKQLKKPPVGQLNVVTEKEDPLDPKVVLEVENPQEQTKETIEYSKDFIAAALLLYCRGLGIPIPKKGQKSVLIRDGQVMLRVLIS